MEKGKFHWASDQQPEADGVYKVTRRAFRGRPDYEDECVFAGGHWENRRGKRITTVVGWFENGGESEE